VKFLRKNLFGGGVDDLREEAFGSVHWCRISYLLGAGTIPVIFARSSR
jgi:hypothetical protein